MSLKPLIKYIGSKHRSAPSILSTFPSDYRCYYEPFFGSGAVLGHLRPKRAIASDVCKPLIDMWELVKSKPNELAKSYRSHWRAYTRDKKKAYERAKESFNRCQNPQDFLFISRACYGGVIRFRRDGYLSTPIGIHNIISPDTFEQRLADWHQIVKGVNFIHADFETVLRDAGKNDLIYCDPPYGDTQKIVYGAQKFSLERMFSVLLRAKGKGASVALSIDGAKKSGNRIIDVSVPEGLFNSEEFLALGGSMLKRFQRDGEDVKDEKVSDRLLISFLSRQGSLQLA